MRGVVVWHPIDTWTPEKATQALLWNRVDGMQVCEWSTASVARRRKSWVFGPIQDDYNNRAEFESPTHWALLPLAPDGSEPWIT